MDGGMDYRHRLVIRRTTKNLVDDLDVDPVLDQLHQHGVLTTEDMDIIRSIKTRAGKRREFLKMLPEKGPQAYDHFLKALVETEQDFLRDILKKEELREKTLKDWLTEDFEEGQGDSLVKLEDINNWFVEKANTNETLNLFADLLDIVRDTFKNLWVDEEQKAPAGNECFPPQAPEIYNPIIFNLKWRHEVSNAATHAHPSSYVSGNDELDARVRDMSLQEPGEQVQNRQPDYQALPVEMVRWTRHDVKNWLSTIDLMHMEEVKRDFEQANINGKVLRQMDKEDITEVCPDAVFGDIQTILITRDEHLDQEEERTQLQEPTDESVSSGTGMTTGSEKSSTTVERSLPPGGEVSEVSVRTRGDEHSANQHRFPDVKKGLTK